MAGVMSERVGVVNIAIEGQLLTGAFVSAVVGTITKNLYLGMFAAMVAAGVLSMVLASLAIKYLVEQIIIGVLLNVLVIGVTTITFFISRFNLNNEERLTRAIQVMANEINSRTTSRESIEMQSNPGGFGNELQQVIAEISEQHNADINYYSTGGNLLISTQPYIYNKKLLSDKMDAIAYQQLSKNKSIRFLQSEEIGSFRFLSVYKPLTDPAGITYAYLNIPYLNTQTELNQEISGFLATLLNLNAFIFLIAGAIAFYITNRITASFELISTKMQQISLGKINETIQWNRNDELGLLIQEYNKMVKKLEESAGALASSEREIAWREMAQQVAHEIKNPLTPMKLSIQYLQSAIGRGDANLPELYQKTNETLISQIDQLSRKILIYYTFIISNNNLSYITFLHFTLNFLLISFSHFMQ
jgi:HAMP domain-containing protein